MSDTLITFCPPNTVLTSACRAKQDSASVVTDAQLKAIDNQFAAIVKEQPVRQQAYANFLFQMVDSGTSPNTSYPATFKVGDKEHTYQELANIITSNGVTLRQYARRFAKIAYENMRRNNRPPSNWFKKGYTEETKFAAFDFFTGVKLNEACEPEGGATFEPTIEEFKVHQANASINNYRRGGSSTSSTYIEVAGGKHCSNSALAINSNPCG